MNWSQETEKVADWIAEYNKNAGTKGYVLGLSGGLDSAVVAALLIEAVGKNNVYLYFIDIESNPQSAKDAWDIAQKLKMPLTSVSLTHPFREYVKYASAWLKKGVHSTLQLANIKARDRMKYLYDMGADNECLVSGTGNLSELQVGYCCYDKKTRALTPDGLKYFYELNKNDIVFSLNLKTKYLEEKIISKMN